MPELYLDGGDDPSFRDVDEFLRFHFNAKAVYLDNDLGIDESKFYNKGFREGYREAQREIHAGKKCIPFLDYHLSPHQGCVLR